MVDAASAPTKFPRSDLGGDGKPQCRVILPPVEGGCSGPALFEWELTSIYGPGNGGRSKTLGYEQLGSRQGVWRLLVVNSPGANRPTAIPRGHLP
jgi:hypothetical protein